MTAITALGTNTESIFLKEVNSHSLFEEFAVATGNAVKKGAPVKLDATGGLIPAAANDRLAVVIGYSLHDAGAEEYATVAMKAKGIVFARSAGALATGPVKFAGMNATETDYANYVAITGNASEDGLLSGWALEVAAGADEEITVAIV